MSSVVVVGSFNVDHVWRCDALPVPGATIAGRYSTGPGGKGFNQAVAAARAGAKTHFLCALGDDAGGALARSLAAQDGFSLIAEPSNEPTGTGGIYVDGHGRNTIVIGAGANAVLSPAFIENQRPLVAAAKVLLAQLESPAETIESALALAHECGVLTVLNAAPANAPTSIGLLKLSDVLTPNETEFAALLGRHVGERISASMPTTSPRRRRRRAGRQYVAFVVPQAAAGRYRGGDTGRGGRLHFARRRTAARR